MNEPFKPLENRMTNAELADEIDRVGLGRWAAESGLFVLIDAETQIIAALRQSSDKVLVTDGMVEAAAKWISESPLIHEPKLPPPAWMGLARHVLQKALSAAEAEGHHE